MAIKFSHMCDLCFRMLGDEEKMIAVKLVDDEGGERIIKGHEGCVEGALDTLRQLYGKKEN